MTLKQDGIPDSRRIARPQSELARAKTILSEGEVSVDTSKEEKLFEAEIRRSGGEGVLRESGLLLVDKPKGWTSFDVVAKVRGILRTAQSPELRAMSKQLSAPSSQLTTLSPKVKVGHTGTLDPLATGLLVLLLGKYTKKAPELTKLDKTYEVTMKLGQTSTTGDEEGEKVDVSSKVVDREELEKALNQFVGEIEQVPPAYSAIKINGQRAYKLARAGKAVKLEPRKVTVYGIRNTVYEYPFVKFTAKVSSGTYVRSLVEDVGRALGTGAYMSDLRRTQVGPYSVDDGLQISQLKNSRPT